MKILLLGLLLTLNMVTAQTEQPDPASFFPSAVGNVWEYNTDHGFVREVFYRDSLAEDGSRFLSSSANANYHLRFDTAYCVYYLPFSLNWKVYKLDADSGDTWISNMRYNTIARVDEVYQDFIFGENRYVKKIGYYNISYPDTSITEDTGWLSYILLVSGIGEYYEYDAESGPVRILQGCVIDGDTLGTITSVKETNPEILPNEITLHQNYPNPFNPTTNIEYTLNIHGDVYLTIYDVLGRKVVILVDDFQYAGIHRIRFSAEDYQLASGIYLYRLTVNKTTVTKKMILQK